MSKIIYDVYKSTNEHSTAFGKFFGRIVHTETLNTRRLAKHIAEHGSVYTQDVVEGVLTKAEACIVEDHRQHHRLHHHGSERHELHGLRPDNVLGIAKRAWLERTSKTPYTERKADSNVNSLLSFFCLP